MVTAVTVTGGGVERRGGDRSQSLWDKKGAPCIKQLDCKCVVTQIITGPIYPLMSARVGVDNAKEPSARVLATSWYQRLETLFYYVG